MIFLLSLGSGLLLTTAYAPWGWVAAGFLAVLLCAWIWSSCESAWQALGYGFVFGLAHFGSSVYWVYHSMHEFGAAPVWFATLATLLFVAILAIYFALCAYCIYWGQRRGLKAIYLYWFWFPSLWVVFEYLRSNMFGGFAWNLLGQSWVGLDWFGLFSWVGILGVSWFVAFLASTLCALVRGHRPYVSLTLIVLLVALSAAAQAVRWSEEVGEPITFGVVQSGIKQNMKFEPEWFEEIISRHRDMTAELEGNDVIVWAETAIPDHYAMHANDVIMPIYNRSIRGRGELLTGVFYYDAFTEDVYNSIAKVGDVPEFYHKRHLVPFGEHLPLRWLLDFFRQYVVIPMDDLAQGQQAGLLQIGNTFAGLSICYEIIFADLIRAPLPQAQYLVNVSNDSWFGDSIAGHQHLQMAQLRSRELARPMVRAASTGISAFIDYHGRVTQATPQHVAAKLTGTIQPRLGETLFARYGHSIILVYIVLLLSFCLVSMRMKN